MIIKKYCLILILIIFGSNFGSIYSQPFETNLTTSLIFISNSQLTDIHFFTKSENEALIGIETLGSSLYFSRISHNHGNLEFIDYIDSNPEIALVGNDTYVMLYSFSNATHGGTGNVFKKITIYPDLSYSKVDLNFNSPQETSSEVIPLNETMLDVESYLIATYNSANVSTEISILNNSNRISIYNETKQAISNLHSFQLTNDLAHVYYTLRTHTPSGDIESFYFVLSTLNLTNFVFEELFRFELGDIIPDLSYSSTMHNNKTYFYGVEDETTLYIRESNGTEFDIFNLPYQFSSLRAYFDSQNHLSVIGTARLDRTYPNSLTLVTYEYSNSTNSWIKSFEDTKFKSTSNIIMPRLGFDNGEFLYLVDSYPEDFRSNYKMDKVASPNHTNVRGIVLLSYQDLDLFYNHGVPEADGSLPIILLVGLSILFLIAIIYYFRKKRLKTRRN